MTLLKRFSVRVFSCLVLGALLPVVVPDARADVDGKPVPTTVDCGASVYSAADRICSLVESLAGAEVCDTTIDICATGSQEIFTGNQIELASPTNIKQWTGFGGLGWGYQAAAICLLRDLEAGAIQSQASADSPLGKATIEQRVQFLSFDQTDKVWKGYHTAKVCAPVVGCLDTAFAQEIEARPVVSQPVAGGQRAGEYDIYSAHGVDLTADGLAQALEVTIPALQVVTPYGVVSAKPRFDMGRSVGLIVAPYQNNNARSLLVGPWGEAKMTDLYGRNPGTAMTGTYPNYAVLGAGTVDTRVLGWISQAGLGSRSADPAVPVWTPPTGVEYPSRPDLGFGEARSVLEKIPNAYLGAEVELNYSPTDLLPAAVRQNGFITITFNVWVKPVMSTGFTSQFQLASAEIAKANRLLHVNGPPDYRPEHMEQFKALSFVAGSTAAARFALEAGVDLVLHLHVPLLFTSIDLDLINIHPRTTVLESIKSGQGVGDRGAAAFSQATKIVQTGEWFQSYQTPKGPAVGQQHIEACLAAPSEKHGPPPPPTYTPGDPNDLTENLLYPCNICVAVREHEYQDDDGVTRKVDSFIETYFPADQSARPADKRWQCDQYYEAGCFDMCSYDAANDELLVVETAVETLQSGRPHDLPPRCN